MDKGEIRQLIKANLWDLDKRDLLSTLNYTNQLKQNNK